MDRVVVDGGYQALGPAQFRLLKEQ